MRKTTQSPHVSVPVPVLSKRAIISLICVSPISGMTANKSSGLSSPSPSMSRSVSGRSHKIRNHHATPRHNKAQRHTNPCEHDDRLPLDRQNNNSAVITPAAAGPADHGRAFVFQLDTYFRKAGGCDLLHHPGPWYRTEQTSESPGSWCHRPAHTRLDCGTPTLQNQDARPQS